MNGVNGMTPHGVGTITEQFLAGERTDLPGALYLDQLHPIREELAEALDRASRWLVEQIDGNYSVVAQNLYLRWHPAREEAEQIELAPEWMLKLLLTACWLDVVVARKLLLGG